MRPAITLEFIKEAADALYTLRAALELIAKAGSLEEAQRLAQAVLQRTLE